MKNIKITIVLAAVAIAFTSCKDEKQEQAQKSLDNYTKYVDSVSAVTEADAAANWATIESDYDKLKMETENALTMSTDKEKMQSNFDKSAVKYEEFKTKVVTEKEKMNTTSSTSNKAAIYKTLLGPDYVSDDMKFNWVNKNNILGVYDNFVSTVEKNKDTYSREDWDEIKLVYEALDSRKNTVEKEGLSGADNRKIAALKIKFSPMYTVNRMGAKSEENMEAKK